MQKKDEMIRRSVLIQTWKAIKSPCLLSTVRFLMQRAENEALPLTSLLPSRKWASLSNVSSSNFVLMSGAESPAADPTLEAVVPTLSAAEEVMRLKTSLKTF